MAVQLSVKNISHNAYKFLDILLPTRHIMRCVIWIVQKPRQYSLYGV